MRAQDERVNGEFEQLHSLGTHNLLSTILSGFDRRFYIEGTRSRYQSFWQVNCVPILMVVAFE